MLSSYSKDCAFCRSGEDIFGNTPDFKRLAGFFLSNRLVFETQNFAVLPTLGQIVKGYLLIMPKKHFISYSTLDRQLYDEFDDVFAVVKKSLKATYQTKEVIFFEHGRKTVHSSVGCCVEHAHIHAVPIGLKLSSILSKRFSASSIIDISEISEVVKGDDYLFIEDPDGKRYVYETPDIKSQYVRYLIATELGQPDKADWLVYPGIRELIETVSELSFLKEKSPHTQNLLQIIQ
jgi:ATP adenylyltransferase